MNIKLVRLDVNRLPQKLMVDHNSLLKLPNLLTFGQTDVIFQAINHDMSALWLVYILVHPKFIIPFFGYACLRINRPMS